MGNELTEWKKNMDNFCEGIDFRRTFFNNEAIQFMNRGFDVEKIVSKLEAENEKLKNVLSEKQDALNHLIADEESYRKENSRLKQELAEKDRRLTEAFATAEEYNKSIPKARVQEVITKRKRLCSCSETFACCLQEIKLIEEELLSSGKEANQ